MVFSIIHPVAQWMFSRISLEESRKKRPVNSKERDGDCSRYDCVAECGIEGYCMAERDRHFNPNKGKTKSKNRKGKRYLSDRR